MSIHTLNNYSLKTSKVSAEEMSSFLKKKTRILNDLCHIIVELVDYIYTVYKSSCSLVH